MATAQLAPLPRRSASPAHATRFPEPLRTRPRDRGRRLRAADRQEGPRRGGVSRSPKLLTVRPVWSSCGEPSSMSSSPTSTCRAWMGLVYSTPQGICPLGPEVIVLTGTAATDVESAVRALRLGAHDFIAKPPTSWDQLVNAVQRAFEKTRLRRENARLGGGTAPREPHGRAHGCRQSAGIREWPVDRNRKGPTLRQVPRPCHVRPRPLQAGQRQARPSRRRRRPRSLRGHSSVRPGTRRCVPLRW